MRTGTIPLRDAEESAALGARIAAVLRAGDVVALSGELGAGKTSIARGALAALGLAGEAPSPTFAIVQPYYPPDVRLPVIHADLYRIEQAAELDELGLDEALWDAALLLEWPERAGDRWPEALRLTLGPDGAGRCLTWHAPAAWEARWPPHTMAP